MTTITMEHYRDFIGTLAHKRAELNTEIKALEHAGMDEEEYFEWKCLDDQLYFYTEVQEYFLGHHERWVKFDSLELLQQYVAVIDDSYKALERYSHAVLPVDGQETVGVTNEEWDELETMRYNLMKRRSSWSTFAEFCEYGCI